MTDSIKSDVSQMRQTDIDFPRNDDVYFDLDNNTEPSAYTTDEIDEARQAESLIVKGFMLYNRIGFRSAERIYEFRERELYHRLGYKSFHEWLKFSDLLRSTVSPYLHAYIDLTVAREIPVAEYEKIDVGIIRLLRPLLKAGATNSEVRDAFQDSREMIPIDFKALIDEKVKKIEARSNTEGEISSKADEQEEDRVEPTMLIYLGQYKLVPVDISPITLENTAKKLVFEKVNFATNAEYNKNSNGDIIAFLPTPLFNY